MSRKTSLPTWRLSLLLLSLLKLSGPYTLFLKPPLSIFFRQSAFLCFIIFSSISFRVSALISRIPPTSTILSLLCFLSFPFFFLHSS